MFKFAKHFTLAEARAMLPELRTLFADLHARQHRARQADEALGKKLEQTGGDLGGARLEAMITEVVTLNSRVHHLQTRGVVIKDFQRGLVDFPAIHEGREVFLCWELEEDDIEFWHDIDAGYSGRERL